MHRDMLGAFWSIVLATIILWGLIGYLEDFTYMTGCQAKQGQWECIDETAKTRIFTRCYRETTNDGVFIEGIYYPGTERYTGAFRCYKESEVK